MILLALKLVLVPGLVAAVTLGARRWGPRVGGWLTALPVVAGPALLFLAVEQGDAFAGAAAGATLVALIGVGAFGVVYGWMARVASWPACLLSGWVAFGLATGALSAVPWSLPVALVAVLVAFAVSSRLLPAAAGPPTASPPPAWDLPLRMTGALALVLTVTLLAERLGPRLSGALTPFPVALAVVLAFTHAQQGSPAVIALLRGFLPSMCSFALFCFVLAVAMVPLGFAIAFPVALAVQLLLHGATLWWVARSR
jgi:hypothetical protein